MIVERVAISMKMKLNMYRDRQVAKKNKTAVQLETESKN